MKRLVWIAVLAALTSAGLSLLLLLVFLASEEG